MEETLTQDIVQNPYAQWEDKSDPTVPTATLQIYNFIGEYLGREKDTHVNRASAATMCFKRRWYKRKGFPETPLTPRKMVNFLLGDLSEKTVQFFIKNACVGHGKIYNEVDFGKKIGSFTIQGKEIEVYSQEDLEARIGDITVTAHVDGWGKRWSDNKWELIEIKSAADYGFDKFKTYGPEDYLKQAMVNLQTNKAKELGATSVRFFYLKKNTGHIWDRLYDFDLELAKEVEAEYLIANSDEEPRRPHIATKGKLAWQCHYCPYTQTCWPEAKFQFKNGKPLWTVTN